MQDFLYVDTDKVRSMLGQIEGGITESEHATDKNSKRRNSAGDLPHSEYQEWGNERYVHKSFGDSIFPRLESMLTSEGMIKDISSELTKSEYWTSANLRKENPPGSIIRLSALASIFDARYVASSFAGLSAAALGIKGLNETPTAPIPPSVKKKLPKTTTPKYIPMGGSNLEDDIPDFNLGGETEGGDSGISGQQLRSVIRLARGLFTPGLHLNLFPVEGEDFTVGARLQEGRQYLDSDPDVLFARYGTGQQKWTIVGSIGHYAEPQVDFSFEKFVDNDDNLIRGRTAKSINSFMGYMGSLGFLDLPQYPGFSVVPLAVYREIPRPKL
ncbi:DUF6414 family protein [Streptomyces sp. H39-S7]|uniref:DUF6414 family protein n=1 Tax=Streptomyces sp. H39-S7 TaxID=3004357 RepID=UPI0022B0240A|nr:hypothetical protein [Streptomyces sp. H39-S7]MCZ4125297.1 hypothetical protein [Streptomyces sp. H39-S7]